MHGLSALFWNGSLIAPKDAIYGLSLLYIVYSEKLLQANKASVLTREEQV